ncbi:unnamed protein product [Bursaphelenchus okinawaensis]|uniref:Protein kinase domain-containing protein n=1 Tax=Bursaphelenchus okinawaensis TaxID=465554 RepID=A0A811LDG3_9BILA|nr:unnamed protein product [Bursaphelenchus okinawaensis]CAG9121898.1 unnamed protein product [Bursaphelenchus okinawaensis]
MENPKKEQLHPRVLASREIARVIWSPLWTSNRKKRIDDILYDYHFFFGTMLDDESLQTQLLVEEGEAFLITAPRDVGYEKYGTHRKWQLVFLANSETIIKAQVLFLNKKFVMMKDRKVTLEQFMEEQQLTGIERLMTFQLDQIKPKMALTPALSYPIDSGLFPLGRISKQSLEFGPERTIPVMCMKIKHKSQKFIQKIKDTANEMLLFGNERIWRLWGVCDVSPNSCILVMEDIVYGSLSFFVGKHWNSEQLIRFSHQTCEALRYIEKYGFVHHHLNLDCLMITYRYNIKLAFYGLTDDALYPERPKEYTVDQARWIPWECLPDYGRNDKSNDLTQSTASSENSTILHGEDYTSNSMSYTFGSLVWSMCHAATLPFEDQLSDQIMSRGYRKHHTVEVNKQCTPNKLQHIIFKCWATNKTDRPSLKEMKIQLRTAVEKLESR